MSITDVKAPFNIPKHATRQSTDFY